MNGFVIVIIVLVVLIILCLGLISVKMIDWRTFFVRRYGPDYKKGLAHIKYDGKWVYRNSELVYESPIAATYTRITDAGEIQDDIVPNKIGFSYDEYTGRRQYRVIPGGAVAFSDDGEAPAVNFPAGLISLDTLGKLAYDLATSVKTGPEPFNWKPFIIVGVVLILVVGGLFGFGVINIPNPGPAPAAMTPATTENTTVIFKE